MLLGASMAMMSMGLVAPQPGVVITLVGAGIGLFSYYPIVTGIVALQQARSRRPQRFNEAEPPQRSGQG